MPATLPPRILPTRLFNLLYCAPPFRLRLQVNDRQTWSIAPPISPAIRESGFVGGPCGPRYLPRRRYLLL